MALTGTKTFVGFGLGAIQSGLFLYEAFQSGAFCRLVVAEVVPEVVEAVRKAGGDIFVNIAHQDRIESTRIGPVEIFNPAVEDDRLTILDAIIEADEMATAVPSVAFYSSDKPGSIHRLLANGLTKKIQQNGPRALIYTAENNNHAAEILEKAVMGVVPQEQNSDVRSHVCFLNTVIGKMSQIVTDATDVEALLLKPITPEFSRAYLVEDFNRILISKIQFPDKFQRGINVFQEKDNLLPFEEAKLYGHNATHALMGYLGAVKGLQHAAELKDVPGMLSFARAAFIKESGAALILKYGGSDPLFTEDGYGNYADDLLERMTNPFLRDAIERVTRDTERKLGWNDRLIGTMRLALGQGIEPIRYAFGATAALTRIEPAILDYSLPIGPILDTLWQEASPDRDEKARVTKLIETALVKFRSWRSAGYPNLELTFS
jgi:mannitol-1-phosphate 5-dehydrogenase